MTKLLVTFQVMYRRILVKKKEGKSGENVKKKNTNFFIQKLAVRCDRKGLYRHSLSQFTLAETFNQFFGVYTK